MVLRIGPAGALPLRLGVRRRRRRRGASDPRHARGSRRGRQRGARGVALRHEHSPLGNHHHPAAVVVRLAVAARDGGRGQEEHGAEEHLHQRIRAGRHGSARLHVLSVQLPATSSQSDSAGRLGVAVRRRSRSSWTVAPCFDGCLVEHYMHDTGPEFIGGPE